jgi:DNA-binding SARP family transcriptional activator
VHYDSLDPQAPTLQIRLLGEFALVHHGSLVPIRACGQRLLAFLGLQRRPVPRATLAGVLWPLGTAGQASANLRAALSRLPRPGGMKLIDSRNAQVTLSNEIEVDLRTSDARIDSLRSAPEPAGAEPLVEDHRDPAYRLLDSDILPLWDDDWVLVERERYRQARLHALERLSVSLRQAGHQEEALQAALSAVAGEPLRESAHRRVIEVHLAEGNPTEALRQYEIYRRLLRDELGLRPSENIRHLVRELLGRPDEDQPRAQHCYHREE